EFVAMGIFDTADQAVQPQTTQVVAHAPGTEMFTIPAEQAGEVSTQLRVVEPLSLHAEQHQRAKQRLRARVAKTQRTGTLGITLQWLRHLIKSVFADSAIVRDGLDVKQTSVGLEAD